MHDRPFTLKEDDEASDDEQIDDNEHGSTRNQHIHENYKVDNERGKKSSVFSYDRLFPFIVEMKQIKWELDRERTFAQRSRRFDQHMKKTGKRKPKLTRREKRRLLHPSPVPTKKKKRVHFS